MFNLKTSTKTKKKSKFSSVTFVGFFSLHLLTYILAFFIVILCCWALAANNGGWEKINYVYQRNFCLFLNCERNSLKCVKKIVWIQNPSGNIFLRKHMGQWLGFPCIICFDTLPSCADMEEEAGDWLTKWLACSLPL